MSVENYPHRKDDPRWKAAHDFLVALLEQKFTKIPKLARKKLDAADMSSLQRWNRRVAQSKQIMEVFRD
jgi:hypothetical protein